MPRRGVSIDYRRRTALYRLFDSEGRLLYVGITFNPRDRWAGHSSTKSWWKDVARRSVEWHDTRWAAEAAEVAAILAESPLYNIAGAEDPPLPTAPKQRRIRPVGSDDADRKLAAKAAEWRLAKEELHKADADLRALVARGRAAGKGPSHMAKLTGFTREWVAKIAPDPKRQRDVSASRNIAES